MIGRLLLVGLSVLLTGCALMDTGEIDYRRAAPAPDRAARVALATGANRNCEPVDPQAQPGDPPNLGAAYPRWACHPLLPAPLIGRNTTVGAPIGVGDIYSIRIQHAFITDMIEDAFSFRRLMNGRDVNRRVGELVILAHSFEFGAAGAAAADSPQFRDFHNMGGVRVVYYNPDVEEGQSLNFADIPLRESAAYQGRPIGIQLIVLELDRMSGPMRSLMRNLADLGRQSAVLPSGPAASALLQLGTSLISQDNDDVMFEYRFVLDRSDATNTTGASPFEAGRYVLRRTHERRRMQHWNDLVLDHDTGRLMRAEGTDGLALPFEEETYFTLHIVNHGQTAGAGFSSPGQTLDQLGADIRTAADRRDAPIAELADQVRSRFLAGVSQQRAGELAESWRNVATRYRVYGRLFRNDNAIGPTCIASTSADVDRARSEALFVAQGAMADFITRYRQALEADGQAGAAGAFSRDSQRATLSGLYAYFSPFPDGGGLASTALLDPDEFGTEIQTHAGVNLTRTAQLAAERHWSPRDCAELIAVGLATAI